MKDRTWLSFLIGRFQLTSPFLKPVVQHLHPVGASTLDLLVCCQTRLLVTHHKVRNVSSLNLMGRQELVTLLKGPVCRAIRASIEPVWVKHAGPTLLRVGVRLPLGV